MKLISGFAWMASSRLGAAMLQALAIIIVARGSGPAEFGMLATYMGAIIVLQALLDFGLSTHITKSRAGDACSPEIMQAFRLYKFTGIALFSVLCAGAVLTAVWYKGAWWLLLPMAVAGCIERHSDVRLLIAIADGDVWKNSLNLIARRASALVLLLVGINLNVDVILAFGCASALASIISLLLARRLVVLRQDGTGITWSNARGLLRSSRAYWANSLGAQVRNLDVLLVGAIAGSVTAGYYGAVSRALSPLRMVTSSLSAVLLPVAVRYKREQRKSLVLSIGGVLAVMSAMYVGLAVFAEDMISLLLGSQFTPATSAFILVVLSLVFASISSVLTPILQARGVQALVGRVSIFTSLVSLGGIAIGVQVSGVTGAGAGLAVSYVLQCLILVVSFIAVRRPRKEIKHV